MNSLTGSVPAPVPMQHKISGESVPAAEDQKRACGPRRDRFEVVLEATVSYANSLPAARLRAFAEALAEQIEPEQFAIFREALGSGTAE